MSAFPPPTLKRAAIEVAEILRKRGETVAVAESAAGGLISAALLSLPGASAYYSGGATLYTLKMRKEIAGWTDEMIASYKGPNVDSTLAMAEHLRKSTNATWCIGESGVAGPTGSKAGAHAGLLSLAIAGPYPQTKILDTGTTERVENMLLFAEHALGFFKEVLQS